VKLKLISFVVNAAAISFIAAKIFRQSPTTSQGIYQLLDIWYIWEQIPYQEILSSKWL